MIRAAAVFLLFALAACARAPAISPAQALAISEQADAGAQVYQDLQLIEFEQQMIDDDKELTYGYAVVNCGLRDGHWLELLRQVYAADYAAEFQRHPLTPQQESAANAYAQANISDPFPPATICGRLAKDSSLADLDYSIGAESLILISREKKPS